MTPEGLALVKAFEGCRLVAYRDIVGVWTIGFGHTQDVYEGQTITQDQADAWLEAELDALQMSVLNLCLSGATSHQADALTSLSYNIGLAALSGSTVLRCHNAGDFSGAADAFLLWNKAGGVVVQGLVRRREAERTLYLTEDAP